MIKWPRNSRGVSFVELFASVAIMGASMTSVNYIRKELSTQNRRSIQNFEKINLLTDIRKILSNDQACTSILGGINVVSGSSSSLASITDIGGSPSFAVDTRISGYEKIRIKSLVFGGLNACQAISGSSSFCEAPLRVELARANKDGDSLRTFHNIKVTVRRSGNNVLTCLATTTGTEGRWAANANGIHYNGGNVGIGTTNPAVLLEVQAGGSAQGNGRFSGNTTVTGNVTVQNNGMTSSGNVVYNGNLTVNGAVSLGGTLNVQNAATLHSLSVSGNSTMNSTLGVTGTTNLNNTLTVNGNTSITGSTTISGTANFSPNISVSGLTTVNSLNVTNGTLNMNSRTLTLASGCIQGSSYNYGSQSGWEVHCENQSEFRGSTFVATSDENLKSNIEIVKNPLDKIKKIRGVNYRWIDSQKRTSGVIAQELVWDYKTDLSHLVEINPWNGQTYTVNYNGLHAYTIESIKELNTEIEITDQKITRLMKKVCDKEPEHSFCKGGLK